ncbi:hypothetical protein [Polaribacter sp. M15]
MKKLKTIYKALVVLLIISACTEERSLDFLDNIAPPTNVAAAYTITQDNSGLVTIIPTAEGAVAFDIDLGDSSPMIEGLEMGKNIQHTYAEGTYNIKVSAYNSKGDVTELTQELVVSFKAPENLVVTIDNDAAITKQVNISATADFAATYEFYSGEAGVDQPVATANIGDAISYQYAEAGMYSVKVIAKGGAIQTTEYTTDFEVTEILAPIASAAIPPARNDEDVISIYSEAYTDIGANVLPDWGQSQFGSSFGEYDLNGDKMLQYTNLSYQGIAFDDNKQDVSNMEFLHLDVWTPDVTKLKTFIINETDEVQVTSDLRVNQWTTINIPLSEYTNQGLTLDLIRQFKFESEGPWPREGTVFVDNIYFWKSPAPAGAPILSDDFEGNGNITSWAGDAAGINTAFANPFKDALNDSETVLEYSDTGGQYANIRFDKGSNFDLTGGNSVFSLKIYVPSSSISGNQPNQISLKLQDGTAAEPWAQQTEIIKAIALDTWQTVSFDFATDVTAGAADPLSRTDFNRVVLQVNSENNNDTVTAYIDDFTYGLEVADTEPFVNDDFEGNGTITTWAGDDCGMDNNYANPFKDALNSSDTVLEYNDTGGQYANVRFDISPNYDLNAKSKFSLKIYVPSSSLSGSQPNQISLKLQDADPNPWERQSEIIKTIALDTWQEVTFDFATDTVLGVTDALSITNFSRVVLQVNSENNNDTVIAYIDDIKHFK